MQGIQEPPLSSPRLFRSTLCAPLRCLLLLLFLGGSSCWGIAQQESQQPQTVSGQVINAVTGAPIFRALVHFNQDSVLTDREGRFEFRSDASGVPQGYLSASLINGNLSAEKPGYFSPDGTSRSSHVVLSATGAASNPPLAVLRLYPEAILSGSVETEDGEPLTQGFVQLQRRTINDGKKEWQPITQMVLSAQGEFRFAELRSGEYRVLVQPVTEQAFLGVAKETYVPIRYPAPDGSEATALHLSAGQQVAIQLTASSQKSYTLAGRVLGATNSTNIQIKGADGELLPIGVPVNAQTGEFRGSLPEGTYDIRATAFGQDGHAQYGSIAVTISGKDLEGLTVPLQPAANIPIVVDRQIEQVDNSSAGPVLRVNNMVPQSFGGFPGIQLVPVSDATAQRVFSQQEQKGDQTHFSLNNVLPGRYQVLVSFDSATYVKSLTWGGVDLMREPMTVDASAGSEPIYAVLRNDFGQLKARLVKDGSSSDGYLYVIPLDLPESMRVGSPAYALPGESIFKRFHLPPGRYLLLAYDQPHAVEYRNPAVLEQLSRSGQTVTVPANGEISIDVEVLPSTGEEE